MKGTRGIARLDRWIRTRFDDPTFPFFPIGGIRGCDITYPMSNVHLSCEGVAYATIAVSATNERDLLVSGGRAWRGETNER